MVFFRSGYVIGILAIEIGETHESESSRKFDSCLADHCIE
jgi:hypothetical protein